MAENFKYVRLAETMKVKMNQIISERFDDLDFVTVVDIELTKDLGDAKVFVQCLTETSEDYVIKTLQKKEKFIKKILAESVKMRRMPNLIFKYDHRLDNYNKIENILNQDKLKKSKLEEDSLTDK